MERKCIDKRKSGRNTSQLERLKEILLIDDNRADARLTIEALKDVPGKCQVTVMEDGKKALDLLRQVDMHAAMTRPDLILLDLNLPNLHGHEVLAALKADPTLHGIPVVVLTTSRAEEDKQRSYKLGAEYFLVKPTTWDGYQYVAETIYHALQTCKGTSKSCL
jgi:CheY-like chemotaxis protein